MRPPLWRRAWVAADGSALVLEADRPAEGPGGMSAYAAPVFTGMPELGRCERQGSERHVLFATHYRAPPGEGPGRWQYLTVALVVLDRRPPLVAYVTAPTTTARDGLVAALVRAVAPWEFSRP